MSRSEILHRPIAIDEFLPMIGQALLADCDPRPAELVLVKVDPNSRQATARIPFTLIFRSSIDIQLVAGMYPLRCGEFGPEIVYVEPMVPPRDAVAGNYYQAVFD